MSSPWRSHPGGFVLAEHNLRGKLSLYGKSPGLRRIARGHGGPSETLLSVASVEWAGGGMSCAPARGVPLNPRVRGAVVDVMLSPSERCSVGLQLYWHCSAGTQLDLEILATSADPLPSLEVLTTSSHASGEVLVHSSARGGQWVAVQDAVGLGADYVVFVRDRDAAVMSMDSRYPADRGATLTGFYKTPVVLFRPPRQRWSYAEICTRESCARIVSQQTRTGTTVSFGLFGADLEKGVIFRGHLRGVFVPRSGDTRQCLRLAARLAAERPRISV